MTSNPYSSVTQMINTLIVRALQIKYNKYREKLRDRSQMTTHPYSSVTQMINTLIVRALEIKYNKYREKL